MCCVLKSILYFELFVNSCEKKCVFSFKNIKEFSETLPNIVTPRFATKIIFPSHTLAEKVTNPKRAIILHFSYS